MVKDSPFILKLLIYQTFNIISSLFRTYELAKFICKAIDYESNIFCRLECRKKILNLLYLHCSGAPRSALFLLVKQYWPSPPSAVNRK